MATNDLADLKTKLALALRDADNEIWTADELGSLLGWSSARLYPRVARAIEAEFDSVNDQQRYDLPAGVFEISQIDLLDGDGNGAMRLPGGTWEIEGDPEGGSAKILINRIYSDGTNSFRVHGYGSYDLTTNLPLERHVPIILARARSEAYRRTLGDRAKFQKWQALNQTQNISVNEMIQMVNEADAEAKRLEGGAFTWRKPKPARV